MLLNLLRRIAREVIRCRWRRSHRPRTAAYHFERESTGGAVVGGIMGHAGGQSKPHRQSAVKRLNQRLFVHAQHQRALGRIEIEPSNIFGTRPIPCAKVPEQERHVVSAGNVQSVAH